MDSALQLIIGQVRAAAAAGTALRIRGGGSKDFYGEATTGELLDTLPLAGISSYEPTELVVTVRAGTPLAELEAVLAERGQCLPFEPPHFGGSATPETLGEGSTSRDTAAGSAATVGGMVAAGLSGPARASVGAVRDYVLGVTLLNGKGELLTFGGQVMKNVAGYDVSRLMVGAMGTLGLITEVSLKVLPLAPAEVTLKFEMSQADALTQLNTWGAQPLPLNASCWVRDDAAPHTPELLFVRLRGAVAAVESACTKMLTDAPGQRMDNVQTMADWTACRNQKLPFFNAPTGAPVDAAVNASEPLALWRLSLPPTAPVRTLPWPQLVEWHGGQRWLWAPESALAQLRQAAASAGGSATIFIAASAINTRARGRFDQLNPAIEQIHRRLKAEFDPEGIFNPGRMYPNI